MKLREILLEMWDIQGGWIHSPSGRYVDSEGLPHVQSVFTDPDAYGLSPEELDKFCPGFSDTMQSSGFSDDKLFIQTQDCAETNDGEWKDFAKFMYSKGWVRYFRADSSSEAIFSGRGADFTSLLKKGGVHKRLKGFEGVVTVSLDVRGQIREGRFEFGRGKMGNFIREVEIFLS